MDLPKRVRTFRAADGRRRLEMVTPIYNEKSCSQAECHAHPGNLKVLGVLDLALNLDSVDKEVASMKARVLLVTAVEITLIGLFIIFFTRRFVAQPIDKLIEGIKAVSQMELDKPLDIADRSEELDELARSFDVMRERLRVGPGGDQPVHPEPGNQGARSARSSSRRRRRSCCTATGWPRSGSFPPAWRTRSTTPSRAC